jgi:hypothetical protein
MSSVSGRELISRREFLAGAGCAGCGLLAPGHALAAPSEAQFCINSNNNDWGNSTWISSTPEGYAREGPDQAAIVAFLNREDQLLARFFKTRGGYNIMVGYNQASYRPSKNIIYIGDKKLPKPGENFLRTSAIFAHETAHRFQVMHGIHAQLMDTDGFHVKYVELHADYLAGAYMAASGGAIDVRDMFFDLGDLEVYDRDHHGFKPERFLAFSGGFADYHKIAARHPKDILAVAFGGIQYVRCIIPHLSGTLEICKGN